MSLLDGLLGGAVGAEMATVVNSFIQQHGGVQGIVTQLEQQGLGATARSWVSSGPNQAISAAQISQVFSSGVLGQLAAKAGMNPQELAGKLAQALPAAIDKLTPGGTIPTKTA
ncbi:MAG TPA: YidB family protein [Steroidobacteraceae bacterium]|nr:YidB family protein [Steroidobacteraceae bacterium]